MTEPTETTYPGSTTDETPLAGRRSGRFLLFAVAATIIVADHLSKRAVESWLPLNTSWAPWPEYAHWFQLTHVANTGAAFGLLPGAGPLFTVAAILVAIVIVVYNFQLPPGQRLLRLALGLQLGGAIGNLIDRFRLGHVTDFFDFGPWAIFNIADASIVLGVVFLGWLMLQERREELAQTEASTGAAAIDSSHEWSET